MQILIHRFRSRWWLLFALVLGASPNIAFGQTLAAPEYKIKAAYLYNFAVLTEWPTNTFDSPKTPLTIGVFGKDPFGRILEETMKGKKIGGRKIEIERYKHVDDIKICHLLFISPSESDELETILQSLHGRPILTVSEIDRFNYRGGMIWLKKQNDEIKFRIRQSVVRESNLKLSSKLLALAINGTPKRKGEK